MNYHSKVSDSTFQDIKSGKILIETRLNDEAHRKIRPSDMIIFMNRSTGKEVVAKVVGLLKFNSFVELFNTYTPDKFGADNVPELLDRVYAVYSKEDEMKQGVLGIKIHVLRSRSKN